jgi:hypothetical protein
MEKNFLGSSEIKRFCTDSVIAKRFLGGEYGWYNCECGSGY